MKKTTHRQLEKISLIIAVYNQARNLHLILNSVSEQTYQSFEIVIADDGSSDHTAEVIDKFKKQSPHIPIRFITQEDNGFRKTVILNKAINNSAGDYLIFIDGDMLLEKHFIEFHLKYKKRQQVLCGYRGVKLSETYTKEILYAETAFDSTLPQLLIRKLNGDLEHPLRGLVIHNFFLRMLIISSRKSLSGCNFSLFKDDLFKVNGFNEDILEHGFNDYELGHRLKLAGFDFVNVSRLCNTYHLYHPTRKTRRQEVREKIALVDKSTAFYCANGLKK